MDNKQVGHYKILEKLGSGGMGEVWLAEDTRLERKVALKFLPYHAAQDEVEKARFIQEAKAAARLKHQNIAQVYEIGEENTRLYIVMEYVEGGSLRDQLDEAKGRPIPLDKVLNWTQEAAEGLAEAHSQGIVHRDIKPDNLMLTGAGQIKITDFGLARLDTATRLTAAGATLGTVNYISPEQVTGRDVDHRADLFSLGATFYELLTGQRAFEGADANATYYAILNQEPEPITRYRRDVTDDLEIISERMVEKDPELRYQSALEIASDIKRIKQGRHRVKKVSTQRRSIRERINSLDSATWVMVFTIAVALAIQTHPSVITYRRMARDYLFHDLDTDRDNDRTPLPYHLLYNSRRTALRKLEDLKFARMADAYIAAALIKGYRDGELDVGAAVGISPNDPSIRALHAVFRYMIAPDDRLGLQWASLAHRLDPDNGAYALLVAVGAMASGDADLADEMMQTAVAARKFAFGWNSYLGSVYRSLKSAGILTPAWPVLLPGKVLDPQFDWIHDFCYIYMDESWEHSRSDHWTSRIELEPLNDEERLRRAELVELLAYRILADASNPGNLVYTVSYLCRRSHYLQGQLISDGSASGLALTRRQDISTFLRSYTSQAYVSDRYQGWELEKSQVYYLLGLLLFWTVLLSLSVWIVATNPRGKHAFVKYPQKSPDAYHLRLLFLWAYGMSLPVLLLENNLSVPVALVFLVLLIIFWGALFEVISPFTIFHRKERITPHGNNGRQNHGSRNRRIIAISILILQFIIIAILTAPLYRYYSVLYNPITFVKTMVFLVSVILVLYILAKTTPETNIKELYHSSFKWISLVASILLLMSAIVQAVHTSAMDYIITLRMESPGTGFFY